MNDDVQLQALRLLQFNPALSQRDLAKALGISLGRTNARSATCSTPKSAAMDLTHLTAPDTPLAIVRRGYVGLPLAVEFGKRLPVIGFDISQARVAKLQAGHDSIRKTTPEDLAAAQQRQCSNDAEARRACRLFIATVPIPVDDAKRPDGPAEIARA